MNVQLKLVNRLAWVLILGGIAVIVFSYGLLINTDAGRLVDWIVDLTLSLGTGLVATGFILIVVELNLLRFRGNVENKQELQHLIEDLGSRVNSTAIRAAETLMRREWWKDGALRGINLSDANLQSANLLGINLTGGTLHFADLREANLAGAILIEAELNGTKCQKIHTASTRGALFVRANLDRAEFIHADLSYADFRRAILTGVDFSEATLTDANFEGAEFDENTILPDGSHWSEKNGITRFTKRKVVKATTVSNTR